VTMQAMTEPVDRYALLTDGTCVQIRTARPADWQAVHDFAAGLSRDSVYRRFFGLPKYPGVIIADAVCAPRPDPGTAAASRGALIALRADLVVGLAEWIRAGKTDEAEVAFAVADELHRRGVGTLLAEHLLDTAYRAGVRRLTAVTQSDNRAMLEVFTELGLPVGREWDEDQWALSIELDLAPDVREALRAVESLRERAAGDSSLRGFLEPRAVALIGDQADPVTRAVRENLRGFTGPLLCIGLDGSGPGCQVAADPTVDPAVDLAVITSPPEAAVEAARACAARGVKALIVTATGFDAEAGRTLLEVCRRAGMRLMGPGSLGVANLAGGSALNATATAIEAPATGPRAGRSGSAGVAVQSGGVGAALLGRLARLGIGPSSFAAVGEKYDVSANDLLMHWESDPGTRLGLLHVESFGNPRKFARTARRLSRRIPLLAVDPERSPSAARTALYAQAGIAAVPSLGALVAAAALLACQPLPLGRRVAVLANTHGTMVLARQLCVEAGLDIAASLNLTPAAGADALRRALAGIGKPEICDAVLVVLAPTVPGLPLDGLTRAAVAEEIPLLAVLPDQAETVAIRPDAAGNPVPCYNDTAVAALALVAAACAASLRVRDDIPPAAPPGIDYPAAAAIVDRCLTAPAGGELGAGELGAGDLAALLAAFGLDAPAPPGPADAGGARLTVASWQDPVFGPLLTCVQERPAEPGPVLLLPAAARDLTDLAARALGQAGRNSQHLEKLLVRVAHLIDGCPQVARLRVTAVAGADGQIRVIAGEASVAPARPADPHLRSLRRAPVE
jgi:succinyl-CoA synthetase alpha subunit/GNAT superfamily N-acetyltransferase